MLNKSIFSTVAMITLMLGYALNANATSQGFKNCSERMYSLRDLKSNSKNELVKNYCTCIASAELSEKLLVDHPQQKASIHASQIARKNASKIARILKRNHQYPDTPKCDI